MKRNGNHFGVDLGIILGVGIISGAVQMVRGEAASTRREMPRAFSNRKHGYFILGISRADLWSQGTPSEGVVLKISSEVGLRVA